MFEFGELNCLVLNLTEIQLGRVKVLGEWFPLITLSAINVTKITQVNVI